MRVLIEVYRKWEIFFDTDKEEFYTTSNEYDREQIKRSYASTKKFIDDYIKENQNFKPIWVQNEGNSYGGITKTKLIGIRKDGLFTCENAKGNKSQFSKYDEKSYFLVNEENDVIFKEIDEIEEQRSALATKASNLRKSVIKVTVKQFREELLGQKEEE